LAGFSCCAVVNKTRSKLIFLEENEIKKLIFFMLVVGIASAANAMTLKLSMGDADTVDVDAISAYTMGDDTYFFVGGYTSEVTVSGGTIGIKEPIGPVPMDSMIWGDAWIPELPPPPPPDPLMNGKWGFIGAIGPSNAGTGTYVDEIDWVLVGGATYAEIYLIGTADFMTYTTLDTITVPEPMTIALLGLGGLMILRRRR
jgi:hypothetical protein